MKKFGSVGKPETNIFFLGLSITIIVGASGFGSEVLILILSFDYFIIFGWGKTL